MKNAINTAIFLVLFTTVKAQEGIKFEHSIHWKDILAKAKTEKKYIFIDCYTTWCGPCKYMSKEIFPKPAVGKFYNDNYINVSLQMDSTLDDNGEVKFKYEDAAFIKTKYPLQGYPTYLYFNSDGELVHRNLGRCDETEFITKGINAFDSSKQYYTQLKKYEEGLGDTIFLRNLALLALESDETAAMAKFAKEYISLLPPVLNKEEDIQFIYKTTSTIKDTGFILIMKNLSKFEDIIEKNKLYASLKIITIRSELTAHYVNFNNWDSKKWADYSNFVVNKYSPIGEEAIFQIKIIAFQNKDNWGNFINIIEKFRVRHTLTNDQLNNYAWNVFQNCSDVKVLKRALKLSKASFNKEAEIDPNNIDTYANILYKIGRKKDAIEWENKAKIIAIKNGANSNWGTDFLHK